MQQDELPNTHPRETAEGTTQSPAMHGPGLLISLETTLAWQTSSATGTGPCFPAAKGALRGRMSPPGVAGPQKKRAYYCSRLKVRLGGRPWVSGEPCPQRG